MDRRKNKKPYSERSDLEKIQSNWRKIRGFIDREEWSSAVVRAATVAEIATNLVVKHELQEKRGLESEFVDHLMLWANGIQGKYQKLIMPSVKGRKFQKEFASLQKKIGNLNKERNSVAHQGQFKKKSTAVRVVGEAREIINILVEKYHKGFKLEQVTNT